MTRPLYLNCSVDASRLSEALRVLSDRRHRVDPATRARMDDLLEGGRDRLAVSWWDLSDPNNRVLFFDPSPELSDFVKSLKGEKSNG